MKVVFIGTRGIPGIQGGVETRCEHLCPRLVNRGCEVVVFTRKPYVKGPDRVFRGVTLIPLGCPKQKHLEAIVHSLRAVLHARKLAPDILHIQAIGPSLMTPLAKMLGMRVVITTPGSDYQRQKWGPIAKAALRLGEYLGCRWADQVICVSEAIAAEVERKCRHRPVVVLNGVEIPQPLATHEALTTYGLEKGRYILTVGRLVPEKGFHDLIEAFGRLQASSAAKNLGQWKLVIVGVADHEDRYSRDLQEQASRTPNVIFTGFVTGTPRAELYSHAGLFALPSYFEGLSLALLEAMSYGLSCLVSNIPANRAVALAPERYFRAGDIQGLVEKLQEFLKRPLSEQERSAQLQRIAERHNWEAIADQTLELYRSVLSRPR